MRLPPCVDYGMRQGCRLGLESSHSLPVTPAAVRRSHPLQRGLLNSFHEKAKSHRNGGSQVASFRLPTIRRASLPKNNGL
jgi:hypothetical protein